MIDRSQQAGSIPEHRTQNTNGNVYGAAWNAVWNVVYNTKQFHAVGEK